MPAKGLRVAPLWRRAAALAIDLVVNLAPTIAGGGGAAVLYTKYAGRFERGLKWPPLELTRPRRVVLFCLSAAFEARIRNWRSPGYRALGLRRVDLRTAGPVSLRSALVRSAAAKAFNQATRPLLKPWERHRQEHLTAVRAQVEEQRRAGVDELEAADELVANSGKLSELFPARSCLPPLIVGLAPHLMAVFSPLHQTLWERLAGTVVVED